MDVFRLSPSTWSSFLVLIILWESLLLFLFWCITDHLCVSHFEWCLTRAWFCAVVRWPFGKCWFTELCGFSGVDGFLSLNDIKMSHLFVSPLMWEIWSVRKLSTSQWWIQVLKNLISYQSSNCSIGSTGSTWRTGFSAFIFEKVPARQPSLSKCSLSVLSGKRDIPWKKWLI